MFETTTSLSLRRLVPAALFMLAALAGTAAGAEQDCPTLLRAQCASCHKLDYICPKMAEGRSSLYWKRTISDMVDEGAVLTGREQAVLVRCLSSRDARARASIATLRGLFVLLAMAILGASSASSAVALGPMDQPTAILDHTSMTTARHGRPWWVRT